MMEQFMSMLLNSRVTVVMIDSDDVMGELKRVGTKFFVTKSTDGYMTTAVEFYTQDIDFIEIRMGTNTLIYLYEKSQNE